MKLSIKIGNVVFENLNTAGSQALQNIVTVLKCSGMNEDNCMYTLKEIHKLTNSGFDNSPLPELNNNVDTLLSLIESNKDKHWHISSTQELGVSENDSWENKLKDPLFSPPKTITVKNETNGITLAFTIISPRGNYKGNLFKQGELGIIVEYYDENKKHHRFYGVSSNHNSAIEMYPVLNGNKEIALFLSDNLLIISKLFFNK